MAAILDCRLIHGILWVPRETFLKAYLLEKDHPQFSSKIQGTWHHLLADGDLNISGNTVVLEKEMRREPQDSSTPSPRFQKGTGIFKPYWWNLFSQGLPEISHLEKASWKIHRLEFQSWKVHFKTEECLQTADHHVTKHWIKEAEIAKSIGKLMTSRLIVGRTNGSHYDMPDAMIASPLISFSTGMCISEEE